MTRNRNYAAMSDKKLGDCVADFDYYNKHGRCRRSDFNDAAYRAIAKHKGFDEEYALCSSEWSKRFMSDTDWKDPKNFPIGATGYDPNNREYVILTYNEAIFTVRVLYEDSNKSATRQAHKVINELV